MDRDLLVDNVHPGTLAGHDIFMLFAIMYKLPVEMCHLPLDEQESTDNIIKLGIERLASIATYAEYYCTDHLAFYRMSVLKNMVLRDVWQYDFNFSDPDGSWLSLLRFSRALGFPELYVFIILSACQLNLRIPAINSLTAVLGFDQNGQTRTLLRTARESYLPAYQAHIGNIVHIPLMGLADFRAWPCAPPADWLPDEICRSGARILAGTIWEAHMRAWMYWRNLEWRQRQEDDRGTGLRWRQRFPRYGVFPTSSLDPSGIWETDRQRV